MNDIPPYAGLVIYNYIPDDPAEQSCHNGETITITNNDNPDWLYFENSAGQKGWIPQKYVQRCTVSQSAVGPHQSTSISQSPSLSQSTSPSLFQSPSLSQLTSLSQTSTNLPPSTRIVGTALSKEEAIKKMQELGKNKVVRRIDKERAQSINRTGNFLYVPLKEIIDRESTQVPTFFWNATNFIENKAVKQEGIYRLSADKNEVEKLREKLEKDPDMPLPPNADSNVIATLVKRFLQFLPTSLIPSDFYSSVLDLEEESDKSVKLSSLITLIGQFPREHLNLLLVFLKHLQVMLKYSAVTNMGIKNIATVFSPCIFRKEDSGSGTIALGDLSLMSKITELLCEQTDEIVGKFPFPQLSIFADLVGPSDYAISVNPFTSSTVSQSSAYSDIIEFPLPPTARPKIRKKM